MAVELDPVVHRLEVDGVPVFWQQGPPPLSAGLCFAVGRRDEDFAAGGVTHLVEHLVMGALPRTHLDRNACVSLATTEFTATGRPEAVREFLHQVCGALSALPTERLATEARVLAAEEARSGGDAVCLLLLTRYGATGLGLAGMVEPALLDLSPAQLQAHAARWFTRQRAALWLTGPPPEGLRLPLPRGSAGARAPQRRLPLPLPAATQYAGPDVGLSFEGREHGEALLAGLRILLERMEQDLRHVGGHSYDVDFTVERVEGDAVHVAFVADAPLAEVPAVARGMHAALQRLAAEGPTPDELAHDLEGFREHLRDPRSAEAVVASAAVAALCGEEPDDQQLRVQQLAALAPEQVAGALREVLDSVLLLVPEGAADSAAGLPQLPGGSAGEVSGRVHKRRLRSDAPWGARLVSDPAGTTLRLRGGPSLTVRHDDCVAVGVAETDHPHLELVGADGTTVPVCATDWKDGQEAVRTAERATAGVPRFVVRPDADGC
jgi:hypothetical protein